MSGAVAGGPVADLAQAPQIVLQPPPGDAVVHWLLPLDLLKGHRCRDTLRALRDALGSAIAFGPREEPTALASLGLCFEGLEALCLPLPLQQVFRRQAPAFVQGAALRAASHLGDTGPSAATSWEQGFGKGRVAWCLSLHGRKEDIAELECLIERAAEKKDASLELMLPALARWLPALQGGHFRGPSHAPGQWVHFGYRDGITEVCIRGIASRSTAPDPIACEAGSLLLGHRSDIGDNPFALSAWPDLARRFFANSSFGVLRKMKQEVQAFEGFLAGREDLRAELCGRQPDGTPLRPPQGDYRGHWDLDLTQDPKGQHCPFGAHVRRMRGSGDAHGRERALLRRSVPYGQPLWDSKEEQARGLLGHFFCSNLETQFEHLLGQWADRAPLGSPDPGDAKDPLCGNHESADAQWVRPSGARLRGLNPWTVTLGTLYLWYPSRFALDQLIDDRELKAIDHWPALP